MDGLTEEAVQKAFDKTRLENTIKDGVLELITKDHYEKALHFLRHDLMPSEYISKVTGFQWNSEMEAMFMSVLQQHLSLILLDESTGDVMGVRLMGVTKADEKHTEDEFTDPSLKLFVGFWNYGDEQTKFFERFKVKETFHYFGLGVGQQYRRRGIGTLLVDLSLKFIKNLNISPAYVKAEASSTYSMRIFEKLGFELLAVVPYEDFKRDGKVLIPSSEDNTCMKTYVKVV